MERTRAAGPVLGPGPGPGRPTIARHRGAVNPRASAAARARRRGALPALKKTLPEHEECPGPAPFRAGANRPVTPFLRRGARLRPARASLLLALALVAGGLRAAAVPQSGAGAPARAQQEALPPEAQQLLERCQLEQELVLAEPTAVMLGELLCASSTPAAPPAPEER